MTAPKLSTTYLRTVVAGVAERALPEIRAAGQGNRALARIYGGATPCVNEIADARAWKRTGKARGAGGGWVRTFDGGWGVRATVESDAADSAVVAVHLVAHDPDDPGSVIWQGTRDAQGVVLSVLQSADRETRTQGLQLAVRTREAAASGVLPATVGAPPLSREEVVQAFAALLIEEVRPRLTGAQLGVLGMELDPWMWSLRSRPRSGGGRIWATTGEEGLIHVRGSEGAVAESDATGTRLERIAFTLDLSAPVYHRGFLAREGLEALATTPLRVERTGAAAAALVPRVAAPTAGGRGR